MPTPCTEKSRSVLRCMLSNNLHRVYFDKFTLRTQDHFTSVGSRNIETSLDPSYE